MAIKYIIVLFVETPRKFINFLLPISFKLYSLTTVLFHQKYLQRKIAGGG
jgi:hypothetical protein